MLMSVFYKQTVIQVFVNHNLLNFISLNQNHISKNFRNYSNFINPLENHK